MSLKNILFGYFILASFTLFAQQEPQYTQYMYNTMSVNPAYAGQRGVLSVNLLHRSQWVGIEGAPETQTLAIHSPIKDYNIGVGLSVVNDRIGSRASVVSNQTFVDANVAYDLKLAEYIKLSFGLKIGGQFFNVDYSGVQQDPSSPADPLINSGNISRFSPIFGAGMYFHNRNWYLGAAVPSLVPVEYFDIENSSARNRRNFYFIGGYVFKLNDELQVKAASLLRAVAGAPVIADVSANAYYNNLVLGLSWRLGDSVNALAGIQINEHFYFGYAYDLTATELGAVSNGSHEVMLRFEAKRPRRNSWKRCF